MPILIDTHTHIYLPEFETDRAAVIERAVLDGVGVLLLPAIDSTTHEAMLAIEAHGPAIKSMMGLHPCSVKGDFEVELQRVRHYLEKRKFVAVGEVGLDFYWDRTFTEQQYTAFHTQVGWAMEFSLPVVIHSRNATDECIEVIRQYPGSRGVFHCFSGTQAQAEAVMGMGWYLGIGGVVTFKNSGLDKVVSAVGLERVVLETDAPYLAPVPFRGKRNESAYTKLVAQKLSELLRLPFEEVARITSENARTLFELD